MLQGWWPPPRGLRVISHLDTGWRTELSKPWEAAERFLSDSASRDRPGGDFGMSRLWCQPGPSLCPPLMEWEAGRGRSRMDTGPKAKGKASNPAKLQLQVRAKLRAGLISPSPAGARCIPGGRRTCPELSLSTRRFLGCLEGLRKSSSAMAGIPEGWEHTGHGHKVLGSASTTSTSSSGNRNINFYLQNIELNNISRAWLHLKPFTTTWIFDLCLWL